MAYTLAEFYKDALEGTDFLKMGVIGTILRKSKAMEVIPWRDVTSLENIAVRYNTLPDVSFRRINEGYTPSEGTTGQVGSRARIADRLFIFDNSVETGHLPTVSSNL